MLVKGKPARSTLPCEGSSLSLWRFPSSTAMLESKYFLESLAKPLAGMYSSVSTSACVACSPGSVTDTLAGVGATICTACAAGQYSPVATAECVVCPSGSITNTASAGASINSAAPKTRGGLAGRAPRRAKQPLIPRRASPAGVEETERTRTPPPTSSDRGHHPRRWRQV